jgi:hypothetical protein
MTLHSTALTGKRPITVFSAQLPFTIHPAPAEVNVDSPLPEAAFDKFIGSEIPDDPALARFISQILEPAIPDFPSGCVSRFADRHLLEFEQAKLTVDFNAELKD